jgi:hypothetical protein
MTIRPFHDKFAAVGAPDEDPDHPFDGIAAHQFSAA